MTMGVGDSIATPGVRWLVWAIMIQRNAHNICRLRSHTLYLPSFSLFVLYNANTIMTARLRLYTLHAACRHNATQSLPCYRLLHVSTRQLTKANTNNDGM